MHNASVPKRMWSVHNVACQNRTNNDTEGWNKKWNRTITKAGPGYYETVLQLGLQQGDTENVFAQIAGRVPPPPCKAKHVKKDARVQE